jgi:aminoglycoside phosphotransferase family enzyme
MRLPELHAAAPVATGVDSPGRMAVVLEGNRQGCLDAGLPAAQVEAVAAAMRARLADLAPLLAARAVAGFVRRCMGTCTSGISA